MCVCLYRPINTEDRSWPSNDYKTRCTYVKEILSSRTFRLLVCFLVRSRARARTSVSIAALVLLCRFACLLRIQAFKLPLACLERENSIKNFVNSCKRQVTRQRLPGEIFGNLSLLSRSNHEKTSSNRWLILNREFFFKCIRKFKQLFFYLVEYFSASATSWMFLFDSLISVGWRQEENKGELRLNSCSILDRKGKKSFVVFR